MLHSSPRNVRISCRNPRLSQARPCLQLRCNKWCSSVAVSVISSPFPHVSTASLWSRPLTRTNPGAFLSPTLNETMTSPYQQPISFTSPTSQDPSAGPSNAVSELPQHQVDAIIRTKRKAREPKACYPCHARKVKCDRQLPCDGCVKRDHANLCSYERPSKKRVIPGTETFGEPPLGEPTVKDEHAESRSNVDHIRMNHESAVNRPSGMSSGGGVSVAREEWDNVRDKLKDMETTIFNLRMRLDKVDDGQTSGLETGSAQTADASSRSKGASPEREGIHAANTLGEGTVHLGSRSVLAYILNNKSSSDQVQTLLEGGILPKLGLDNESATYPFVDLWSSDMSSFDVSAVCSALPTDQQCKM